MTNEVYLNNIMRMTLKRQVVSALISNKFTQWVKYCWPISYEMTVSQNSVMWLLNAVSVKIINFKQHQWSHHFRVLSEKESTVKWQQFCSSACTIVSKKAATKIEHLPFNSFTMLSRASLAPSPTTFTISWQTEIRIKNWYLRWKQYLMSACYYFNFNSSNFYFEKTQQLWIVNNYLRYRKRNN